METLNEFLQALVTMGGTELRLEPNKEPYVVSVDGNTNVGTVQLQGPQISTMVFPLIPPEVRHDLPNKSEIEFTHPHNLCKFEFVVKKSPAGFVVSVRPLTGSRNTLWDEVEVSTSESSELPSFFSSEKTDVDRPVNMSSAYPSETISINGDNVPASVDRFQYDLERSVEPPTISSTTADSAAASFAGDFDLNSSGFIPPLEEYVPEPGPGEQADVPPEVAAIPLVDRRNGDRREMNSLARDRMDALFRRMSEMGASDLHLSVSVAPMVRRDGKMTRLECSENELSPEVMRELLFSIMPSKNREEFGRRNDTDFAYEVAGLARFRCNIFTDRKGPGAVFRIIPTKKLTAEELGLSTAIMDLCSLSKGLVVVTGPAGSGKSTTLCAMVDWINKNREGHIITIEDPIEFVHENHKCLVNQREVHNHTDSFTDALRAARREDPDVLLVGEMRDHETMSLAIETAETGHLVFGTLHTTTSASAVDRIIDQFPADRQQQVRVMLSESLRGVIAQTLVPKIGGGRVAALEVLIITPAISDLIREGKTIQIPSAVQTGKSHGMVMLNDALLDLVKSGLVTPHDAYIKTADKTSFESMLKKEGLEI